MSARPIASRRAGAHRVALRGGAATTLAIGALAVLGALALYSVHSHKYAIAGAAVVLCVALAAWDLTVLPGLAVVGTLLVIRLAGASTNLSVSDALLFVGMLSALPLVRLREDRELRALLGLVAIYEVMFIPVVLDNPYRADFTEWGHEAVLAGGSLVVGWALGRQGRGRVALGGFLAGACVLGAWAAVVSPLHHFHAVYLPGGYQKNYIGDLLGFGTLVAYANPPYLSLAPRTRRLVIAVTVLGLAASQARQAAIGLVVAWLVVLYRNGQLARRGRLVGLLAVPVLAYIGYEVDKQVASSNRFNSVHQRLSWYHDSLQLLHLSPWLGEGLRWWYTNRFSFSFQPPNAELEMLTSGGLLGLAAFLVLHGRALAWLRRIDPAFGTLAFAALLMRVVQAQFDIFWVTGQSAIPWLIVGIALGARVLARQAGALEQVPRAARAPAALGSPGGPWRWSPTAPHVAARRG